MSISIVPGSGKIVAIRPAQVGTWTINHKKVQLSVNQTMHAEGWVDFNVGPNDPTAGWEVGWIQVAWSSTMWLQYRGQFDRDGSVLLQIGRMPPSGPCRDTSGPVNDIFTDKTDIREFQRLAIWGGRSVWVSTTDAPEYVVPQIQTNSLTGRPNALHELQMGFNFCTVLTVRDPDQVFHHQAHFYWYVGWQGRFRSIEPSNWLNGGWAVDTDLKGTRSRATGSVSGAPTARFASALTDSQPLNCVQVEIDKVRKVSQPGNPCRREFRHWHTSDVRR